jgi:hypothetical protein
LLFDKEVFMKSKIKKYSTDERDTFVEKIRNLRFDEKLKYGAIASTLNKEGFRNREGRKLNAQFIGNVLFRWAS